MTSIPGLPPAFAVLSNAAGVENKPRAPTTTPDFQSQLKTHSKPASLPPGPASAQAPAELAESDSRRADVEAMLQLLAWRKITLNAPNKMGRLAPSASANSWAISSDSIDDQIFQACAETINLARTDEHKTAMCPEQVQDQSVWRADSCGSDVIEGAPYGSGLNASAIAVALSGTTLIWLPFETVRAPLQSPRVRFWPRRNPPSAEAHHADQPDADVSTNG